METQANLNPETVMDLLKSEYLLPQTKGMKILVKSEKKLPEDLSWYRVDLFRRILENIFRASGWEVNEDESNAHLKLLLSLNSLPLKGNEESSWKRTVVGVVRNSETKQKEKDITVDEFIRMREEDLSSSDGNSSLASATVDFEMLHVSMTSCVNFDFQPPPVPNRGSSNRGVIFCFYNYARITTILNKFDERVSSGEYPPLQELDMALVKHLMEMKPEMQLVHCCLQKCTTVLKNVAAVDARKIPQPHMLCRFLSEVAHPISRYYRTFHVLTDPSAHLLPTMHIRIHLLRAVQRVLLRLFNLIGIEPPSSM